MPTLTARTAKQRQVVDITDQVVQLVEEMRAGSGFCHLFLRHTTAALTLADLDPGTDMDILDAFEAMVPDLRYRHLHNPSHVPSHILSSLIGVSLLLPLRDGRLRLGTWQRIVLIELDGPRVREIEVSFVPSG